MWHHFISLLIVSPSIQCVFLVRGIASTTAGQASTTSGQASSIDGEPHEILMKRHKKISAVCYDINVIADYLLVHGNWNIVKL